jgi:hypothetical protein
MGRLEFPLAPLFLEDDLKHEIDIFVVFDTKDLDGHGYPLKYRRAC